MKNRLTFLLICTLLCFSWVIPVQAQEENEGVAMLIHITPKAGHKDALIKGITDYHHWIASFEGHTRYTWWEVLTGPESGTYYAHSGGHNWADFDAKHDWDEKSAEVIQSNVMPHVDSMTRSMEVNMDEVSHWPEDWDGYSHVQVEAWYVKNGHFGKFNKGLKRIVTALKAGGFPYHFGFTRVASGGHGGQLSLISPVKGWAGMSEEEPSFYQIMTKELGGEEQFEAFMTDWSGTFKVGHSAMMKYMPGASDYGDDK